MMMGPQRIPLVHNRAFGQTGLFPIAQKPVARRLHLGEPPGPTGDGATIDYQKALAYYDGIRNNFEALVALIGDSAKTALAQAKASYEEALKDWTAAQPTRI
jgi:hypothetical protein